MNKINLLEAGASRLHSERGRSEREPTLPFIPSHGGEARCSKNVIK